MVIRYPLFTSNNSAKRDWFKDFLQEIPNKESLLDFHHFGGKGHAKSNLKVNFENQLKTVSITQYTITRNEFTIHYEDLIQEKLMIIGFYGT
jgi:hypothetical protein